MCYNYIIESMSNTITTSNVKPEFQAPSYIGISKRTQLMFKTNNISLTARPNNILNDKPSNILNDKKNNKSISAEMGKGYQYMHESFLKKGFQWTFVPDKSKTSYSYVVPPCCTINDYKGRHIPVFFIIL